MKLIKIVPSTHPNKKYTAIFNDEVHQKTRMVQFGAHGMDDYTLTHDKDQRSRYRQRHKKDLLTDDPTKPGFLSYYILWGDSTSLSANVRSYKKRFHL